MPTTKSKSPRSRSTGRANTTGSTGNSRTSSARNDDSLATWAGRTIRERPYASAAGAVTAVAAAVAGAYFLSRRDQSWREPGDTITHKVKGTFADARARIKDLIHRDDARSQQQIAEEALTLTATGKARNTSGDRAAIDAKAGAIAY